VASKRSARARTTVGAWLGIFGPAGALAALSGSTAVQILVGGFALAGAMVVAVLTMREQRDAAEEEREAEARAATSRPELTLAPDPDGPASKKVGRFECAYFRLRVLNELGHARATDLHVDIEEVGFRDGRDLGPVSGLRGMWLAWADRQLRNPNAEREREALGPGSALLLDLVHLNQSVNGKMILDVRPQPVGRPNYIGAAELTLRLVIHSAEADPRRFLVDISYDGHRWAGWEEPAEGHLRVENLRPAPA
jgi:hypothetical protein